MSEFRTELPADVGVETVTFIAFEDDRPTEVVFAGTDEMEVKHGELTPQGGRLLQSFLALLVPDCVVALGSRDAAG